MAKEIVHEDFGEKIGGAKKDLWAARGLYVDDLLGMNEREAEKYVKKIMSGKAGLCRLNQIRRPGGHSVFSESGA